MTKRGQITVYVIIGLIALATVVTAFYAKDYVLKVILNKELEENIIIPEKIKPINTFVLSCLKESGEKALKIIGQQGGYTTIPRDPFPSDQLNLISNALTIYGNNNVAYWFYEQPNKIQKTQMPTESDIEFQISNYIENDLNSCLNNFEGFQDFEIIQGDLKVSSELNENEVKISLDFPLNIKTKDFEFKINKFSQKINSPLYDLYTSAKKIFENLNSNNDLEHKTLTMLITYSEIPYSGSTDDCIPPIWNVHDVESNLKKIISNNIQALKVQGTNFGLTNSENNYFVLGPNLKDQNLDVNFLYSENWPLNLDINPREGSLLKAQSVTEKLGPLRGIAESFACISTYHFIYDTKYPVLVILNKDGYTFQFAVQVIIDNNEPRKAATLTRSTPELDTRICDTRKNEITVFTKDINGKNLDNVDIKYKCISNQCDIGKTKLNSLNEAILVQKYPQCLNGALIASKDNYHFSKQTASTLESFTTTLFLEPYKNLNVDVLIERAGSGKIDKDEQVYIQLSEEEKEHYETLIYPDTKKIKLISGKYKAITYLISNYPEGLTINEQVIENCFDVPKQGILSGIIPQTEKKCVKTVIPATTVNKIISGYAEFEFEISRDDLEKNKIIFHIPYVGKPTRLSEISKALGNKNVPKPEFK